MALTKITRGVIKANENYDTHNINSTGIVTAVSANFTGDVSIGGTLTYQDVTNIDSVGVITARNGIDVTGGSVGVGTDNPLFKLQVNHADEDGILLKTANTSASFINFSDGDDNDVGQISYDHATNHLGIRVNAAERLRITSTGSVIQVGNGSISNPAVTLSGTAPSDTLFTSSTGKIGFGTDNPLNGLDIFQSDGRTRVTSFGHIITQNRIHSTTNYWSIAPRNGGELDIAYGSPDGNGTITADKLTITTDGKLGINHTSPTAPLSIKVGSSGEYVQDFSGSSTKQFGFFYDQNNWNAATFRIDEFDNNGTATSRLTITDGGKVGVGCDAEVDFQVRNGNGGILKVGGSGNSATGFQIQYNNSGTTTTEILTNYRATSASASLKIDTGTFLVATGTNGAERLRITPAGNMGLGTNSPGSYDGEADNFVVASSDHTGITIASTGSSKRTNLYFADGTSGDARYRGAITYDHNGDHMLMRTSGAERFRINSDGGYVQTGYGRYLRYYTTTVNDSMYRTVVAISMYGNTAYEIRFSGSGNGITHAKCMASHWTSSYDLVRESYLAHDSYSGLSVHDQINRTSGTQGSWSFSRPSSGQTGYQSHFIINKSAGSYGGGMMGCIILESDRPYELLSIT